MQKINELSKCKILYLISLFATLVWGSGCSSLKNVHIYDQASLNLATQTANTFSNANFSAGIAAERQLMGSIATTEQSVVLRQSLAIRNAAVLQVVGQASAQASLQTLQDAIEARINVLTDLGIDGRSNLFLALNLLQNHQGTLANDTSVYAANRSTGDPDLPANCTNAEQIATIRSKIVTPSCTGIFDAWVSEWTNVYAINNQISSMYSTGDGLIAKITGEINKIQSAQNSWNNEYTTRLQAFNSAKAAYDAAATNNGDLMNAALTLSNSLSALNISDADAAMTQLDNLGFKGLGLQGYLEQISQERSDVVAAANYLSASGSKTQVPTNSALFITLLPVIKMTGNTFDHPPALHLYLAQENLRIKANEIQNQINTAKALLNLKIEKRKAMTSELMLLTHADLLFANIDTKSVPTDKLLAQWIPTAKVETARSTVEALIDYAEAWTSGRTQEELIDYQIIDIRQTAALNSTDTALQSWNNLISVPLQQLIDFYGSGIKPETIANLIGAAGVSAAIAAK